MTGSSRASMVDDSVNEAFAGSDTRMLALRGCTLDEGTPGVDDLLCVLVRPMARGTFHPRCQRNDGEQTGLVVTRAEGVGFCRGLLSDATHEMERLELDPVLMVVPDVPEEVERIDDFLTNEAYLFALRLAASRVNELRVEGEAPRSRRLD